MAVPSPEQRARAHADAARDLRAVAEGERAALARLYDRYTPMLFAMLCRLLPGRTDAEEVVQDTWLRVWRRASSFDPERGSVAAWLMTMARNRALDRLRSATARRRREEKVAAEERGAGEDPSRAAHLGEARRRIRASLSTLEPKRREVIELAYWQGLSQREISTRLGIPLGTVKTWTRVALRKLRAALPEGEL